MTTLPAINPTNYGRREGANLDWTPEQIAELTRLWATGLSGGEIGKVMGISKNAVVGKVHRLKLPGRPSPIKRAGRPRIVGSDAREHRRHLKRLGQTVVEAHVPAPPKPWAKAGPLDPAVAAALPVDTSKGCQFPMWGNEDPTHVYCQDPVLVRQVGAEMKRSAYCPAHHHRCFVRLKAAAPRVLPDTVPGHRLAARFE